MIDDINNWKSQRLGKFTSSEIYKLMQQGRKKGELFGKGALTYIREKVSEILTGEEIKDLSGLNAIEWGHANELDAIRSYQDRMQIEYVTYYGGAYPNYIPFNKYSGGSPDAETETHCIEAKCPYSSQVHIDNLLGSLSASPIEWMKVERSEHYCQLQFNMLLTGKVKGHYISFDPRMVEEVDRLAIIEVVQDDKLIIELVERLKSASKIAKEMLETIKKITYEKST